MARDLTQVKAVPVAGRHGAGVMLDRLLDTYAGPVPRYASYPSDLHFTGATGPDQYAAWLSTVPADMGAALYLHVPQVIAPRPGTRPLHGATISPRGPCFAALLAREIALLRGWLGRRQPVTQIHWGGGTPSILTGLEFCTLMAELHVRFAIARKVEVAIELDPRTLTPEMLAACRTGGINRASLAVHDLDSSVQKAADRMLSFAAVEQAMLGLRGIGVATINIDLLYGLARQSPGTICRTIDHVVSLAPDRISLHGVAHMAARDAAVDDAARWRLATIAAERLQAHGYVWIGLDHFARPEDPITHAARNCRLRRTVMGYTTDSSELLLGLGPSAIGALPQGYVQNTVETPAWAAAIARGRLATAKGIAIDDDDRLRRAVIERLMCDLAVDLGALARAYGAALSTFAAEKAALQRFAADGVVELDGDVVRLTPRGRPLMRSVAAVFDRHRAAAGAPASHGH
jgi:oxygen-independent coproporphyrinogen-3 oxidase